MTWIETMRSENWTQASSLGLGAYALGCFTAGYYLVRVLAGRDVRETGSGSVGARNAGRVLGKAGFFSTVLLDGGKGALAVWAARHFTTDNHLAALAMLAVVAGHIWPAQLCFRGGKGMATSLGALLVFDPRLAAVFLAGFLCLLALLRRSVLPGLLALAGLPLAGFCFGADATETIQLSLLAAMVLVAHRKNLLEEFSELAARRHAPAKTDPSEL